MGIERGHTLGESNARSVPSLVECGCRMVVVKAALRFAGFGRTIRAIRAITHGQDNVRVRDASLVERAAQAVIVTAAFFPGRAMCLEQSLTLWWCLRLRGADVQLRFGVQPRPFAAHCWVEHDGAPVLENADRLRQFIPMSEAAP